MSNRRKTNHRKENLPGYHGRKQLMTTMSQFLHESGLEQAIAWLIMEADSRLLPEIATRTIDITENLADTYGGLNDEAKEQISNQICAAILLDLHTEFAYDDTGGTDLVRTLENINTQLMRRVS